MEFKEYKLGDILDISSSKRIFLKEYTETGIPFYRGKEIIEKSQNKEISNKLYISEKRYNEIKNKYGVPKKGDILISAVGTLGITWLVTNEKFYFKDGNLIWLSNFKPIVNNKFIYFYFHTNIFQNIINTIAIGSTQKALTINQLKRIKIKIPNIKIQNKIVNILESIENKLKINNQINDNLFKLAKNYYKEWSKNCTTKIQIREVADEIIDYSKKQMDKIKLINSSDITEGYFPKFEFVKNKNLKGHFKKNFKKYDILYSQIRPRNHHYGYVLLEDSENYLASTRLMVIRNKGNMISSSLLYFSLISDEAINDFTLKTESRSGTFPQGNYEDLSSFYISYSKNQKTITNLLNIILLKINHNYAENYALEQLRDTLLPKLMNGEIDLDKIEI